VAAAERHVSNVAEQRYPEAGRGGRRGGAAAAARARKQISRKHIPKTNIAGDGARGEALEQRDDEHRATNNVIKAPQTQHTWLFGSVPTAVALRGWLD
jgi:hypothetical protein